MWHKSPPRLPLLSPPFAPAAPALELHGGPHDLPSPPPPALGLYVVISWWSFRVVGIAGSPGTPALSCKALSSAVNIRARPLGG